MAVFPKLADPDQYSISDRDLAREPDALAHWIDAFINQGESVTEHALASHLLASDGQRDGQLDDQQKQHNAQVRDRAAAAKHRFVAYLEKVRRDGPPHEPFFLYQIDRVRDAIFAEQDLAHTHRKVKADENRLALKRLPEVLAEIDATDPDDRLEILIRGVFAGNVFDLGVAAMIDKFASGEMDFGASRRELPDRPWLVDDFDALKQRWEKGPHHKAVIFVDNAGADVVLGVLPFAREMIRRGTQVILSANEKPSLNDIIHEELEDVIEQAAQKDKTLGDALADHTLTLISSGGDMPMLDLAHISDELAQACTDVDLVMLEGMGRSIESNQLARFTCDSLKIAMVKEAQIARWLGGKMYDLVCRFELGQ